MKASRGGASPRSRRLPLADTYERDIFRRLLVWLVALKAAGLILVFDHNGIVAFDLPKSLFSRGLEWLIAAVLVLVLLRRGLSVVPRSRLHYLVLAFLAVSAAATALAPNTYIALYGERARYLGLTFLVDMAVLYFAVAVAFRGLRDWAVLGGALALATLGALGYGLLQLLGKDPYIWSDDPTTRPFGTLGNPDMLGHLLSAGVAAGLTVAALGGRGRAWMVVRVAAATLTVAMLALSAFVATRAFLLGVLAALPALTLVYLRSRGADRSSVARLGLAGAVLAVVLSGILLATPLGERTRATFQQVATRDRVLIYEAAVRAIADSPLIGYGPNGFAVVHPKYRQAETLLYVGPDQGQSDAHSWILDTAVATGLPGLAIFVILFGAAAFALWRRVREAPVVAGSCFVVLAAYFGHGLVSVATISVAWVPWLALGATVSLSPAAPNSPRPIHRFGQMLVLGLAVVGALSGVRAWQANDDARGASVAWRAGRYDVAAVAAGSSVSRDGGRADHWNWLGLARDARKEWGLAEDAFEQAATRSPHRAVYWENLALVRTRQALAGDASSGGAAAALAAARRGVEVDPNRPAANGVLAEVANAFGERELALRSALAAIRLYPPNGRYDELAAEAALGMADVASARQQLESVLTIKDSARLRVTVAQLALRQNDRDAARLHASRALELDPANADARLILDSTN